MYVCICDEEAQETLETSEVEHIPYIYIYVCVCIYIYICMYVCICDEEAQETLETLGYAHGRDAAEDIIYIDR